MFEGGSWASRSSMPAFRRWHDVFGKVLLGGCEADAVFKKKSAIRTQMMMPLVGIEGMFLSARLW
jgi:hypothetical protein